ncbi:uncharacterized protein FIBRA_07392 [Fibroporia radiculosa]|uniref:Uncharacterized protein n=1 Tax=Fibroporia radiculosa TaxID=599839 RepID=J4GEB0_9APHY|nr:uncharacterized protein FIBRA_07392 [Fibroporia radiculosa]CCM05183.1 predicted protein [Fibroporia radiculosa]
MDPPIKKRAQNAEEKKYLKQRIASDAGSITDYFFPLRYPIKLLGDIMAAIFRLASPYTPNLIPLAVFLLSIPIIIFLSFSAGWLVWRSVAIAWEVDLPLQFGDGFSPYAEVALPNIITRQPYDISVHLVVPATEPNFNLGNFMTTLTLATSSNRTLAHIRKPSIIMPRPSVPWSFLSNWPGTVDLNIPLLSSFAFDVTRATAKVEFGRRDHWRSLGNGAFLFISFVILASCLLPALELRFNSDPHLHDSPPRMRRRPRRRPSTSTLETDEVRARKARAHKRSRSASAAQQRMNVDDKPPLNIQPKLEPEYDLDPLDPEFDISLGLYTDSQTDIKLDEQFELERSSGEDYAYPLPLAGPSDSHEFEPEFPLRRRRSFRRRSLTNPRDDFDA